MNTNQADTLLSHITPEVEKRLYKLPSHRLAGVVEWVSKNKDHVERYCEEQRAKYRPRERAYRARRWQRDQNYRVASALRSRFRAALRSVNVEKRASVIDLIGCTLDQLQNHIATQFTVGMTWANHGEWHIDHMKPCRAFNLSDIKEQAACFHFTNLRPLWARDNRRKGGRFTPCTAHASA